MSDIQPFQNAHMMKKQLRKEIRSQLLALTTEEIVDQSNKVWMKFFNLLEYKSAKSIGLFLSMPCGEILTSQACQQVMKDKKYLYVPQVGLQFEQHDMDLLRVDQPFSYDDNSKPFYDDWPRNKWNIPEPPIYDEKDGSSFYQRAQTGDIDLLVVPGLGFDMYGGRLGQGKGYYDRFISKIQKEDKPLLVGVCLEPSWISNGTETSVQTVVKIPMLEHDHHMDIVVTPSTLRKMK